MEKFLQHLEHFLDDFFDSEKVEYYFFYRYDRVTVVIYFNTNSYMIQCDNCFEYTPRDLAVLIYKEFLKVTFKEIYGNCKFVSNFIE